LRGYQADSSFYALVFFFRAFEAVIRIYLFVNQIPRIGAEQTKRHSPGSGVIFNYGDKKIIRSVLPSFLKILFRFSGKAFNGHFVETYHASVAHNMACLKKNVHHIIFPHRGILAFGASLRQAGFYHKAGNSRSEQTWQDKTAEKQYKKKVFFQHIDLPFQYRLFTGNDL
jgi:hypothetical protein